MGARLDKGEFRFLIEVLWAEAALIGIQSARATTRHRTDKHIETFDDLHVHDMLQFICTEIRPPGRWPHILCDVSAPFRGGGGGVTVSLVHPPPPPHCVT